MTALLEVNPPEVWRLAWRWRQAMGHVPVERERFYTDGVKAAAHREWLFRNPKANGIRLIVTSTRWKEVD